MQIEFYKYQGTGNDFVVIDNRDNKLTDDNFNHNIINKLCDRRFGIGADGLMLLENHPNFAFKMRYFNADGYEGSLCGNGSRCIIAFAHFLGIFNKKVEFEAIDGHHRGEMIDEQNSIVKFQLNDISGVEFNRDNNFYFMDNGSPHHVDFVDSIEKYDVVGQGRKIRNDKRYPHGTNVNFVKRDKDKIFVRTFERGVEDETLSCGTGVTASAICAYFDSNKQFNSFAVDTIGGKLRVSFDPENEAFFKNVWLQGPAKLVFKGNVKF